MFAENAAKYTPNFSYENICWLAKNLLYFKVKVLPGVRNSWQLS